MTGSIWVPLAASLVACAVTAAGIVEWPLSETAEKRAKSG
jgi:flagellar basal body-associated protein FliL